jgi:murein DD-endopeptidase MepM/ murein hydrolase activator NlpD
MANSRLAQILEQEYKTSGAVGGAVSALGKRSREKMDIRNALFSGGGLGSIVGTKIFGKGYSATRKSPSSTSSPSLDGASNATLQDINTNSKITAKNTLAIPMMARDMNLVRLNIVKMVKLLGGQANRNKTDMFFSNAAKREEDYERQFGKKPTQLTSSGGVVNKEGGGFLSSILGFFKGGIGGIVDTLLGALIKGGLITGFLVALGKYFRDDDFRKSVNSMLDGLFKTVFGDDYKKNLLVGVGIFTGAMVLIAATLKIFNSAILAASRALLGLAVGRPGAGVPGGKGKGGRFSGLTGKANLAAIALGLGLTLKQLYDLYGGEEEANKFFDDESSGISAEESLGLGPGESLDPGSSVESTQKTSTSDKLMRGGELALQTYAAASMISLPGGSGKSAAPSTSPKIAGPFDHLEGKKLTSHGTVGENREIIKNKDLLEKITAIIKKVVEKGATTGMIYKFAAKFGFSAAAKLSAVVAGIAAAPFSAGLSLLISGIGALFLVYDIYQIYEFFVELEKEMDADEKAAKVIRQESPAASTVPGPVPVPVPAAATAGAASASSASSSSPSSSSQVGRVTSDMGTRPDPMNSGKTQNHQGVDVAAPGGTPIYATMDGQARKYTNSPTAGNYVEVTDAQGNKTRYLHMSRHEGWIQGGVVRPVKKGDIIGYVGTTGRSTGNHLHYEEYRNGKNVTDRSGAMLALNPTTPTAPNLASTPTPKINGSQVASASQAQVRSVDNAIEAAAGKPLFSPDDLAAFAAALRAPTMQNGGGGLTQVASVSKATPYERDFYEGVLRTVAL